MAEKTIAANRKAYHDYFIDETIEAGIVLSGAEIKSIRAGKVSVREAYAKVENKEAWLVGMHISPYQAADRFTTQEPARTRKLLLHKNQIMWLQSKCREKGFSLIPLRVYIKDDVAKVEVGLGRGKRMYDKRDTIAKREADREIERAEKYDR